MPIASENRVRIIGGAWRGRTIRFPGAAGLRPTPDRVRETLFNWLGQDLAGRQCLDLYAGSGALSFESLSRGASLAVAVERNATLARALAATADSLETVSVEVHRADARAHLAVETRLFDVIFADPPFDDDPWNWLLPACAQRLSTGGFLYAEARKPVAPPPGLIPWRRDKAGQVHYHLFIGSGP